MSDYIIHEEQYVHKNGKTYFVEVATDYDFGEPEIESDCHGVVVTLTIDPTDEDELEAYINDYYDEDEHIEQHARHAMMRPLGNNYSRYGERKYYDVWESRKKALEVWGTAPENVEEAVEKDFTYIDGWYSDDWHWVAVSVYALDEDGEKDEAFASHVGGFESTIINRGERAWFEEVIEDGVHQVEHDIRKELHKDQLELPLFA